MGEVYLAKDNRLERHVAIKILPKTSAVTSEAIDRFKREAKTLAALSHPNILAIYDVGNREGLFFVVTEFLEGRTLRTLIGAAGLAPDQAREIAISIAEGLSAAHSSGIIHRDLKPENIFITRTGTTKILDFGLARIEPAIPEEDLTDVRTISRLTEPGKIMGTVPYMSPEQVRGGSADGRSDIFSLGCILYEMLSGQRAFARQSNADTVAAILKEEPPALPESKKQIPPALSRILFHCLEKNPDQRFQTARDLAFDLKALKNGSPEAGTLTEPVISKRGYKAAFAAFLVIVIGMIFAYGFFHRGRTITSLAILPFTNVPVNPDGDYLSDGITERIISSLSQLPQLRVMARSTVFTYKGKQVDPRTVGKDLNVGAVLTGTMIQQNGTVTIRAELVNTEDGTQIWGGQYNRPMADLFLLQEQIADDITEKLQLKLTVAQKNEVKKRYTENRQAYELYLKGRYYWNKRTGESMQKAIQYFQQAIDIDPNYALAYAALAECYSAPGFMRISPDQSFPRAKAAAEKALAIDESLGEPHSALGKITYEYEKNPVRAEKEFKKAIELNPNYATAHQWYATVLSEMGRFEEAKAEIQRAIELDPLSGIIQTGLGNIFRQARRYEEAIDQYQKTIEMDRSFLQAHMELGVTYELKSMYAEAIEEYIKAWNLTERKGKFLTKEFVDAYHTSGWRGFWQKDLELNLMDLKKTGASPELAWALTRDYIYLGETDKALQWTEKTYELSKTDLTFRYDLQFNPFYDPIRSDPRFAALLKRVTNPAFSNKPIP